MLDVKSIRKDFPMYRNNVQMQGQPLVWLDNAATTFKPDCVINAVRDYYENHTSNSHRGDYDLSYFTDIKIQECRDTISSFINCDSSEVIFTSGTTQSLNMIAFSYARKMLKEGDEIILSEAEHASNLLPWFQIAKEKNFVIKYVPLTKEGKLTVENFKSVLSEKTKFVSLAYVTNVLGHIVPIKEICKLCHEKGIIVSVDGAQAVPHLKVDVKDLDCDFLSFSGHKLLGPTGIGVLFGKYSLLEQMDLYVTGGGMNSKFFKDGTLIPSSIPSRFEAGTLNIEGILGLKAAIDYLKNIGMDNVSKHEKELKEYAVSELKKVDNIVLYNEDSETGIITFNFKEVFSQDAASHFNKGGIALRSGLHCAKILTPILNVPATIRASLYIYNDKNDVDELVKNIKNGGNFLDAFFN